MSDAPTPGTRWEDADPRMHRTVRVYAHCEDGRIAVQDERTGRITRIAAARFSKAFRPLKGHVL